MNIPQSPPETADINAAQPIHFITIIVPVLNEKRFVTAAIESIAPKSGNINYEILIIDGGSTDGTKDIAASLERADPRIRFIHNEKRLQSAAVNLGVRLANPAARIIVRADSHAIYPPNFLEICVEKLLESRAQSLVVTMKTVGIEGFQQAVAAAQNSMIGNGGSAHRRQGASRYIDHGHHAAFDRDFFARIGGYDETLNANEDVDLDMRIAKNGGRIWLETSIPITYFPRDTVSGLARQYYNYGQGRALTYTRYRYPLKARHLIPVFSLLALSLGVIAGLWWWPFLLLPALYISLCFGWGAPAAISEGRASPMFFGLAAIIMHQAWAAGFLKGMARAVPAYAGLKTRATLAKRRSDRTEIQKG